MKLHFPRIAVASVTVVLGMGAVAFGQAGGTPPVDAPASPKLTVGAAAPALAVESFVKGTPVTALEPGQAYLLHFWAPWKKDSVEQFALLSDLQKRYGEQGLVVIAVASTDVNETTIEKVRTAIEDQGEVVQFRVAWDKGTQTKDAFLKAAGRTVLPCAVLVDKEGRVAVIESIAVGAQFVEPVVKGTHDLAALAAWQPKAARRDQTTRALEAAYQAKKWPEILLNTSELLEVDPVLYGGHAQLRMLADVKAGSSDKALLWAKAWVDGPGKSSIEGLNAVAWALVDPKEPFPNPDLEFAMKVAQRAVELTNHEDGAVLDTLARVYFVKGDIAKAVEIQKQAVAKIKPNRAQYRAQIEAALREYEAALARK